MNVKTHSADFKYVALSGQSGVPILTPWSAPNNISCDYMLLSKEIVDMKAFQNWSSADGRDHLCGYLLFVFLCKSFSGPS